VTLEHFDVIVVGAGISGIGAGYHLQAHCPGRSYAILESRASIGGTWDLFRYPGIRSDSDMYTLGYSFRPWTAPQAIADGRSILEYLQKTAHDYGIDQKIRFGHRVRRASWSSRDARWTVEAERGDSREPVRFTCNFLFMCSGYYDYDKGFTPDFPSTERFRGRIVHPQKWTPDVDYAGKRVVVIGSGATAMTLVPELAKQAAHVTMLQRSPTYVIARPDQDRLANWLRRRLSSRAAYAITRWKNVLLGMAFFQYCRRRPERAKRLLVAGVRRALGADYDVATHFTPTYKPWDQRLCLVPNGDLFDVIREGRASVVTDRIEAFQENGLKLSSGKELEADLIVTATGLNVVFLSNLELSVDGARVDVSKAMTYKAMMLSDVPNLAFCMGYTNASWTLKCDLTAAYVCRLLNHMQAHDHVECRPRLNDPTVEIESMMDFTSGYVLRAIERMPKRGSKAPWKLYQNYFLDIVSLRHGAVEDGAMEFSNGGASGKAADQLHA
jgi:monooxygenase